MPLHTNEDGPVVPGSHLYRALQHVARAIAQKLVRDAESADKEQNSDSHDSNIGN